MTVFQNITANHLLGRGHGFQGTLNLGNTTHSFHSFILINLYTTLILGLPSPFRLQYSILKPLRQLSFT